MATGRRKSTRKSARQSEVAAAAVEVADPPTSVAEPEPTEQATVPPTDEKANTEDDGACPACKDDEPRVADAEKENWIRCDACTKWFHWRCVKDTVSGAAEPEALDKWSVTRSAHHTYCPCLRYMCVR